MAVDLGFIDESAELLESRFFPSKIGGKPAWLDLKNIPSVKELTCLLCKLPLRFLCQLYCPINEKEIAFHRTLLVFLCGSKECFLPNSNRNFVVLRSQLPRNNTYYPNTPPETHLSWRPDLVCSKFGTNLCNFCGIRAEVLCSQSCNKQFCSSEHEKLHNCNVQVGKPLGVTLLAEYGLSIEPEDLSVNSESYSEDSESEDVNHHETASDFLKVAFAQGKTSSNL